MEPLLDYAVRRTVAPASTPVTLAEAKRHCNVVASDEDDLLTRLIAAATELVERDSNRALITQTLVLTRTGFPDGNKLPLSRSPLQAVESVEYVDTAGNTQVFAATNYHVDSAREPGLIWLNEDSNWPTLVSRRPDAVTVTYTAGYGDDPEDVPERARQAVLLLVGHWYRVREAVGSAGASDVPLDLAYRSLICALKPGSYL